MDVFRNLLDVYCALIEQIGLDRIKFDFDNEINFTVGKYLKGKISNQPFDLKWNISASCEENRKKKLKSLIPINTQYHVTDENEQFMFRFTKRDDLLCHISMISNRYIDTILETAPPSFTDMYKSIANRGLVYAIPEQDEYNQYYIKLDLFFVTGTITELNIINTVRCSWKVKEEKCLHKDLVPRDILGTLIVHKTPAKFQLIEMETNTLDVYVARERLYDHLFEVMEIISDKMNAQRMISDVAITTNRNSE